MISFVDGIAFLLGAVIAVPLFKRVGLGATLGYLVAGIIIGPNVLGIVGDVEMILDFAKLGVIFLLFLVGLELAPQRLWALRRTIFGLGVLKIGACAIPLAALVWLHVDSVSALVVVTLGLAFSSTAFAVQALSERGELGALHGQNAFAILLFKYIAFLPLIAALPLMGTEIGPADVAGTDLLTGILEIAGVLVAVLVGGHYLLRPVFRIVAKHGAAETFTATALLVVLGTAYIIDAVGLDMALGAFLAGVLLADSEYRHEIHANIEPFKGLLLGLFFLAVGMAADLGRLAAEPGLVLGLTAGVIAIKLVVVYAVARLWGLTAVQATKLAACLPQGGELAFVLFTLAVQEGVLRQASADLFILVVTLSMAATPAIVAGVYGLVVPRLAGREQRRYDAPAPEDEHPDVIVIGFGRFGQMVGRLLHSAGINFTALDSNPKQVDFLRRWGHRIYYGDAAKPQVLKAVNANQARAVVLAMDNVDASVRIAESIRRYGHRVPIYAIARTREHAWRLMDLGCEVVVREAFSTTLALGEQMLPAMGWDESDTEAFLADFRNHDEDLLQRQYAVHTERTHVRPSDREVAHELEAMFESDDNDVTAGDSRGSTPAE